MRKYIFGHKCKASAHILIIPDSETSQLEGDFVPEHTVSLEEEADMNETPQISLHAMSSILMPQTLKFKCSIGKMNVNILIDRGSTHNFLQSKVVSLLNLPISSKK